MTVQQYRTNLNCGSCVAAVKPHLDGDPTIRRWSVDTTDPNKVLTVEGEGVSAEAVERHVADADGGSSPADDLADAADGLRAAIGETAVGRLQPEEDKRRALALHLVAAVLLPAALLGPLATLAAGLALAAAHTATAICLLRCLRRARHFRMHPEAYR